MKPGAATRLRLRPAHTADELAQIYAKPHEHKHWSDHRLRVAVTTQFAQELVGAALQVADLSCGDAAILKSLSAPYKYAGDYAPGYALQGPIEQTIEQIPPVQAFICCETIEHLDDPDTTLKAIRAKTERLILSTPIEAWEDTNPEHYWAWDRAAVEDMLRAAGFKPRAFMALDVRPANADYCYGIWWCM